MRGGEASEGEQGQVSDQPRLVLLPGCDGSSKQAVAGRRGWCLLHVKWREKVVNVLNS